MAFCERADLGLTPEGVDVFEALCRYVRFLLSRGVQLKCLVAIGSRARGEWRPWSDTDVVIVVEQDEKRLPFNEDALAVCLEPRVFRPEELLRALRELRLTALEAGDHGIPIYDDGFWPRFKAEFDRIKRLYGLERGDVGWVVRKPEGHAHP